MLPISESHKFKISLFVHKWYNHKRKIPETFSRSFTRNNEIYIYATRKPYDLYVPLICSELSKKTYSIAGTLLWKSLSNELKKQSSMYLFSKQLKCFLLNNLE